MRIKISTVKKPVFKGIISFWSRFFHGSSLSEVQILRIKNDYNFHFVFKRLFEISYSL